jgi:hypothetical protein
MSNNQKVTIGFITNHRLPDKEDNKFLRIAKKIGVDLIVFNAAEKFDLDLIKENAKKCDLILNDEADYISLELAKSLETLGCKVIEVPKSFYYTEALVLRQIFANFSCFCESFSGICNSAWEISVEIAIFSN